MLLAAGRGERMRPLTDNCPKPLLEVQGKALALWHLDALARAGVARTVINTAWLGGQFAPRLGAQYEPKGAAAQVPMPLAYSHEGQDFGQALETAGGIARALPLLCEGLGTDPIFWVLAGDVYAPDFALNRALPTAPSACTAALCLRLLGAILRRAIRRASKRRLRPCCALRWTRA